jgi:hypothetical protein
MSKSRAVKVINGVSKIHNNTKDTLVSDKHTALAILLSVAKMTDAQIIKAEKQTISLLHGAVSVISKNQKQEVLVVQTTTVLPTLLALTPATNHQMEPITSHMVIAGGMKDVNNV